ncbi:Metal-independent phosphoserine phosphatase [Bienertia sinuspersici]
MATSDPRVSKECVTNGTLGRDSCAEIIIVRHGETEWNTLGKMQEESFIPIDIAAIYYLMCL